MNSVSFKPCTPNYSHSKPLGLSSSGALTFDWSSTHAKGTANQNEKDKPCPVGEDNEPAEEHEAPPMTAVRPVWEEPAAQVLTVCRVCFGARKIVNLGGTDEPTGHIIEMPCPACSLGKDD
jgi:hypothetical protein